MSQLKIGSKYFFRTVTYHCIGMVESQDGDWVELVDASVVFDSGRFSRAIATGDLKEVEFVGEMGINLGLCVDRFPWKHELPWKRGATK